MSLLLLGFDVGCVVRNAPALVSHEMKGAATVSDNELRITQGTVGTLEGSRLGLLGISQEAGRLRAELSVVSPQSTPGKSFVNVRVGKDDLVPVGGGFRRVLAVDARAVVLDRRPVAGAAPAANALVLGPGAIARFVPAGGRAPVPVASAALDSVDGDGLAHLVVWPGGEGRPSDAGKVAVGAGDAIGFSFAPSLRYVVARVTAGDAARGLPGFIEIDLTP